MAWFIGVDVGGTFTDLFAFDAASGRRVVHKTPSTPRNPALAILAGLTELAALAGLSLAEVERFSHGTTVATNTLLQRRGGRVVLVVTRGFRDLVEIGRQIRPRMYSMQEDAPDPVVAPADRLEAAERVMADGSIRQPLEPAEIRRLVEEVRARGPEAVAVCLLFSFLDASHERALAAALEEACPGLFVSVSSQVQPEFREYERTSTTLINAHLQPVMDRYLGTLAREVGGLLPKAHLGINQSSGGLMSVERARRVPVRTALSGPAAGAKGAIHVARLSGCPDAVTLDMGGTSADVCLIRGHEVETALDRTIGGFPIRLPSIDIHTVGAGGGSIAWFDSDGLLKVGPLSAGADPGPACYGKGGTRPTVSDANAVLGRLGGRGLLGGRMGLDVAAARAAVAPVAERLGTSAERAARGIVEIVESNMVRAIRVVSVERGYDPRDLVLIPFGGAGALHGSGVARALGIRRMLVPLEPGILCAEGLIVSDHTEDFVRTVRLRLDQAALPRLAALGAEMAAEAAAWFEAEAIPPDRRRMPMTADLRYVGQNYELAVRLEPAMLEGDLEGLLAAFREVHARAYGFASATDPVELVNLRLTAVGALRKPGAPPAGPAAAAPPRPSGTRPVWFEGDAPQEATVWDRATLARGHEIRGPAIIEQMDATTLLFPGDVARVDEVLNLMVEVAP